MGFFSRSTPSTPSLPTPSEPVRTREELEAITRAQRTGNFNDPGRGPARQDGSSEHVVA